MPAEGRRRWSAGYMILISFMVGVFALIVGILALSIRPDLVNYIYQTDMFTSLAVHAQPVDQGLEWFRTGQLEKAKLAFSECAEDPVCDYYLKELKFFDSNFNVDISFGKNFSSPNAQYLHALLLSNKFTNITEYTSNTFPLSVVYLYAASTAGHPGALMAMGYRHMHGYGVPKRCETAALNYLEVAKPVANIYANSVPKAVELVRLGIEKDKKILSINEISLFTEVANTNPEIALAVGKRFLLGTDGFSQDYVQALRFLTLAATGGGPPVAPSAWALLGYIHALGLGVDSDIKKAEDYFNRGLSDGLGMNGLGFIRFKQDRFNEAYTLFNQSAAAGSADGMFNLASVYLTGTGVGQNFQRAFMWFTEALRRGHTPAGYALAVMHLNGIGTIRDCTVAVQLLKEVAERGEFVSQTLRAVHAMLGKDKLKEIALFQLLKLAEAGHQVSQENLAHLIDSGKAGEVLFHNNAELFKEVYAQRFFELAADQGSVSSQLRLGDFAFYGWGVKTEYESVPGAPGLVSVIHTANEPDPVGAKNKYWKAKEDASKVATLTGGNVAWLGKVVGTAAFNLGYMYHFGIGVRQNYYQAANFYRQAISKDSHGAWILEWIVDTFIHPKEVEDVSGFVESSPHDPAPVNVHRPVEVEYDAEEGVIDVILEWLTDIRVVVVIILGWLLIGLMAIRRVIAS